MLALQIKPELRSVAEIAAKAQRRVGGDRRPLRMSVMGPDGKPRSSASRFAPRLAVIATIRTMLNYFLAKDIGEFERVQQSGGNPPSGRVVS
jgi:Protein of unknown function (DUF1622)